MPHGFVQSAPHCLRLYLINFEVFHILMVIHCWFVYATKCLIPKRTLKGCCLCEGRMVERFLEADDPVLEEVLQWTVKRDAADVQQLLEWLPNAANRRDQRALFERAQALMRELNAAMNELDQLS